LFLVGWVSDLRPTGLSAFLGRRTQLTISSLLLFDLYFSFLCVVNLTRRQQDVIHAPEAIGR
jgi:hypothetical protein